MRTKFNSPITRRAVLPIAAATFLLAFTAPPAMPASPVVDAATRNASIATVADQEYFLLTAHIVDSEPIAGVAGAARATLSNGRRTEHVLVRTIEAYQYRWASIRDSYRYNIAAYRLGKMLGIEAAPVTVGRAVDGRMASVTLWPDDKNETDDDADMVAFRQLVYALPSGRSPLPAAISNADYTQAFVLCGEIPNAPRLPAVSPNFRNRLKALDRREINDQLGSLLSKKEIEFLWERRRRLVERAGYAIAQAAELPSNSAAK